MSDTASPSSKQATGPDLSQRRLLEGRDYTLRPDGAWIFSAEYLYSRGTCCDSKCLNCPYENSREVLDRSSQRPVISMVPSWTDTFLAAGLNVVARTRYCVHPEAAVRDIPILGGTKTLSRDAAEKLKQIRIQAGAFRPLVVLDREENPKDYADFFSSQGCEILVSHVCDFVSLAQSLRQMAEVFAQGSKADQASADRLLGYSKRAEAMVVSPRTLGSALIVGREPQAVLDEALATGLNKTYYFIWKDPWMVVSRQTWLGAVLALLFPNIILPAHETSKYPTISTGEVPDGSNLLFSSEPFPFRQEWTSLQDLPFVKVAKTAAIVDGEALSWFGLRAIRFLEEANSQVDSSTSVTI